MCLMLYPNGMKLNWHLFVELQPALKEHFIRGNILEVIRFPNFPSLVSLWLACILKRLAGGRRTSFRFSLSKFLQFRFACVLLETPAACAYNPPSRMLTPSAFAPETACLSQTNPWEHLVTPSRCNSSDSYVTKRVSSSP